MNKLIIILFFFIAKTALPQNKAFKARADKAYKTKDYVTAAYYYDKALQNGTTTSQGIVNYFSIRPGKHPRKKEVAYITYQMAESYRLYQNYTSAEEAYRQVVDNYESHYPLSRFWYAVCLRANNHLDNAIKNLQSFIGNNKNNKQYSAWAEKELNNCLFAKEELQKTTAKANKLNSSLNSDASDFALSMNTSKYWLTSSRAMPDDSKHVNGIFFSNGKDSTSTLTRVNFKLNSKADLHYGTPSLEATGRRMYLTIWYQENGKTISGIYLSRLINNQWGTPQKLNNYVNAAGYNAMQPYVTSDGKRLFFASNKPGSIGGTDIWMSDLDIEGIPVNTLNLGSTVNTADDEQAPFYQERNRQLIYSSKGFTGMGDFDLFESTYTQNSWSKPKNMGYPFNSTKADLYYYPDDKNDRIVYVSSDRESDCCLKIFQVRSSIVRTAVLTGLVIDCATDKPLAGVKINLLDSVSRRTIHSLSTNETGKYVFTFPAQHAYLLKLEKHGYFTKIIPIPAVSTTKTDTLYNPIVCQQEYEINKPIVIPNILYDFNKSVLKPESRNVLNELVDILMDNPKIKVELSSHTDSFGPDWSNNRLSQARAQSCVDYIVSKGISPSRIIAKGYGESRPIQPNTLPDGRDNPAGRRLNRRTEFKVLSDE